MPSANRSRWGPAPGASAISPDGKYLFTANGPSDDVSVVDLKTNQEIKRVKAGKSPWSVAVVRQRLEAGPGTRTGSY